MQRAFIAFDAAQRRWLLLWLSHHLVIDHVALEVILQEVQAYLRGEEARLRDPVPYRDFVARARLGVSRQEHEAFFQEMLGDIAEATAPYGIVDVRGDGRGVSEAHLSVDEEVSRRIRARARAAGVSAASVCHLAWGQVLARLTGREEVVFGTVLLGRMQGRGVRAARGGAAHQHTACSVIDRGSQCGSGAHETHGRLGRLLRHEHASLTLAQRCSGVEAGAPLFTTLLNYRYSSAGAEESRGEQASSGIKGLGVEERTNYPLMVSVDDSWRGFGLTCRCASRWSRGVSAS